MPRHCMHYIFEFFVQGAEVHRVESQVFFHIPDDRASPYSSSRVHFIIDMDADGRVTIRPTGTSDISHAIPPPPPPSISYTSSHDRVAAPPRRFNESQSGNRDQSFLGDIWSESPLSTSSDEHGSYIRPSGMPGRPPRVNHRGQPYSTSAPSHAGNREQLDP